MKLGIYPKRYIPKSLSSSDKTIQKEQLNKSRRYYEEKNIILGRRLNHSNQNRPTIYKMQKKFIK